MTTGRINQVTILALQDRSQAVQPHLSNGNRVDGAEVFQRDLRTVSFNAPVRRYDFATQSPRWVIRSSSHPFASSEFLRFWSAPHCTEHVETIPGKHCIQIQRGGCQARVTSNERRLLMPTCPQMSGKETIAIGQQSTDSNSAHHVTVMADETVREQVAPPFKGMITEFPGHNRSVMDHPTVNLHGSLRRSPQN
jgi:hypothetical protein